MGEYVYLKRPPLQEVHKSSLEVGDVFDEYPVSYRKSRISVVLDIKDGKATCLYVEERHGDPVWYMDVNDEVNKTVHRIGKGQVTVEIIVP